MRRSSVSKILTGLALVLFALEAVSQSKDKALASIADNSDEPSGWMRLEIAIFVDTSEETLDSELWEIAPKLDYPTNRRWLTDYAEIKALMDEWGEDAVIIHTDGAIAVVPEPPTGPEPIDDLDLTDNSQDDTESLLDSSRVLINESENLVFATEKGDSEALRADSDLIIAASRETSSAENSAISPIEELAPTNTGADAEGSTENDSLSEGKADQPAQLRVLSASFGAEDYDPAAMDDLRSTAEPNEQYTQEPKQIPLENLQVDDLQVADSDVGADALIADSVRTNIEVLPASVVTAFPGEDLAAESTVTEASFEQSNDDLEDLESITAESELANQAPEEAAEDAGNFFAIEGLGEDFNGLASGSYDPAVSADGSLGTETIDWLSGFETQEPAEVATLEVEPTPPALPASYQTLSLEMLPAGLKKLETETGRRPVSVMSWLQPADGNGSAVIVDTWSDDGRTPKLQGTVQISLAGSETDGYQLTTNLWANTTANYLPEKLPAIEIPMAPTRVLVIEPEETVNEKTGEASVEFIDMSTGLRAATPSPLESEQADAADSVAISTPQLKHAISLNETRDLREGYIRYIDHPVIQVAAVWRELTYAELYELGEAQRVRKDIDSLTRSLVSQQSKNTPVTRELETQPITQ